jgi:hypothetical protein
MLNMRHKIVAFVTVVFTGIALLFEATLTQAIGMLMIGLAIAWVVGSETIAKTGRWIGRLPGRALPFVRVSLAFLLASLVLVLIALYSNFNETLAVGGMLTIGLLISPFRSLPTSGTRLRILPWLALAIIFVLGAVLISVSNPTGIENAEKLGQLAVSGLLALFIGMFWLVKGKNLILKGIAEIPGLPGDSLDNLSSEATRTKRTIGLHVLMSVGLVLIILFVGLLTFSAFNDAILPTIPDSKETATTKTLGPGWIAMLYAWWPYACWKGILKRQPNTTLKTVVRHRRVTAGFGILFTFVMAIAVVFGTQMGNDRKLRAELTQQSQEFAKVALQIGSIKSKDLKTTDDYVDAFTEIEPLQVTYDDALQRYVDVWQKVQERNNRRGLMNIQRLYSSYKQLDEYPDYFDSLRELSALTKRQVQAVRQMSLLSDVDQVEYWQNKVYPLLLDQDALREKLIAAEKRALGEGR